MPASTKEALLAPGDLIANKYRIVKKLGAGGMGAVFEAVHVKLRQHVAIKTLLDSNHDYRRFEIEARAAASLRTPHVVQVFDVDTLEDGTPYMVMELLHGEDLKHTLERRGPLPVAEATSYLLQACNGVAAAHRAGIVHRDLKPENLFLSEGETGTVVKVLDFGISKLSEPDLDTVTATESSFGTPTYMSPEQLRSAKHVDERADIWALGVILYRAVCGVLPFRGTSPHAIAASVMVDEPIPLADLRPGTPPGFDAVLRKAFAKDPEARYENVEKFVEALRPFAPDAGVGQASARAGTTETQVDTWLDPTERAARVPTRAAHDSGSMAVVEAASRPNRRVMLPVVGVVGLGFFIVAVWLLVTRGDASRGASPEGAVSTRSAGSLRPVVEEPPPSPARASAMPSAPLPPRSPDRSSAEASVASPAREAPRPLPARRARTPRPSQTQAKTPTMTTIAPAPTISPAPSISANPPTNPLHL